jgi:hypothetical protein
VSFACVSFVRVSVCLSVCVACVCVCLSVRLSVYLYLSVCVSVWQFNNTAGFLKSKTNKILVVVQALGLIRSRLRLSLGVSVKFMLGQLRLVEWKWSCTMWILKNLV